LKLWEIHLRAITNHVEKEFPGAVTLIRTRGQPFLCSFEPDFCWGRLVNRVSIKQVPGSHEDIFIEPHVKSLAEQVQLSLEEAQKSEPRTVTE
jgi:thioesterase domain-containing protein